MTIELLVAGPWADHTALATAFMTKHGLKWLVTESLLEEKESSDACQLRVDAADEALRARLAGAVALPAQTLESVAGMASLSLPEAGLEAAQDLAYFAHQLIGVGGVAVVVPAAGHVLDAATWEARWNSEEASGLYSLYVALRQEGTMLYSCGMHQFGFADGAREAGGDANEAAWLIHAFNLARVSGEAKGNAKTFGTEDGSFALKKVDSPADDKNHPSHNPKGLNQLI